ncbi:uncharacterized protein LOC119081495 [Bradysia coprophila]|uniref:uncharacterized protein LOC119081495 n=1 Tax=Bradysia coprophila TaxID=38358 RepID=UPI00187DBE8E|nr:uncharacterized protein LOC119081495 [Bradysia coprophila]
MFFYRNSASILHSRNELISSDCHPVIMSKTILQNEITASESSEKKSCVVSTIECELQAETYCWNLNCCCKIESFIYHLPTEVLKRKPVLTTCPNCLSCIRTQLKYLKLHPRKKFRKLAHCLAPMFSCIVCNRFRKVIHLCPFCGIALGVSNVFDCI